MCIDSVFHLITTSDERAQTSILPLQPTLDLRSWCLHLIVAKRKHQMHSTNMDRSERTKVADQVQQCRQHSCHYTILSPPNKLSFQMLQFQCVCERVCGLALFSQRNSLNATATVATITNCMCDTVSKFWLSPPANDKLMKIFI